MSHEWTFPAAKSDDLPTQPWGETLTFLDPVHGSNRVIDDAVIVVPGIMGTELIDIETEKRLWGLDPGLIARMWTAPTKRLTPLAVDPEHTTVRPGRLLRAPTFAPFLRGIEPYTELVRGLERIVRHPAAVYEFGYDWRLPVRHNARLLAETIDAHLQWWRRQSNRPEARVHLVAHSMGGLLCHELSANPGAADQVGEIITLGTPFKGAPKAAVMLGTGEGAPLPARQLQRIAVTMPGLYDLLPSFRCVDTGTDVRLLTPSDITAIGGRGDLAEAALAHRAERATVVMPDHRLAVGVEQPTLCSLRIGSGRVEGHRHAFEFDWAGVKRGAAGAPLREMMFGDGTVPRNSALPPGKLILTREDRNQMHVLPQQHGPLAKSSEVITFVKDVLLNLYADLGPQMGDGHLGIDTPDIVTVGSEFDIGVEGAAKPNDIRCTVTEIGTRLPRRAEAHRRDGELVVSATVYKPGLYRVEVAGSANSAVEQIIMAVDTDR
ncbi:lipase/acyltransferase domain-containing protein [Nocardia sp. JW2]|uniref:lipase/acyltransferase domain-containing protein n=1 Tax=Nocardia sp. JW2 TaxID=3450738 RepID=UPI003F43656B